MKRSVQRILSAALLLAALLMAAGCDTDVPEDGKTPKKKPPVQTEQSKAAQPQETQMKVYFANEDGTKLVAKTQPKQTGDKYVAAVNALIAGTDAQDAVSMIPKGTKLRAVTVKNGVAYVDFSKDLVKRFGGGSAGEIMLVGSIVNTLTEFPEVKAVQILVEGEKVETIAGHMDTSEPLKRFKDILNN